METELILKVVGVGLIVSIAYQILVKSGRDEQAMLVSVAGVVLIMLMIIEEISDLFNTVIKLFGL